MRRDPITVFSRLKEEYGDVVRIPMGGRSIFVLSHPDHARDVLVTHQRSFKKGRALEHARLLLGDGLLTSEGEHHLRQRRLMQPAFHRQRIAAYGDTMVRYADRRSGRWQDGATLHTHAEMMALTLAVVGKTLFDADVEAEARDIGKALTDSFEALGALFYLPFGAWIEKLPLPVVLRFKAGKKRLQQTVQRIIAERRASGADTGDLLSMLLAARDAEGDGTGMSDQQIQDEALTLVLAGHETTANALSWTWYLLAQHPGVEARFHAEVDALGDEPLGAESLARLPYTRMVLSEAMRLYPPAWGIGRRALGDVELGGFRMPAGSIIVLSPYLTQRDSRWFDDPQRFDPDRWLPERVAARPKFSYFPFGAGPRICIGEQFAWMEGVLLLAAIARRWRLRLLSQEPVQPQALITLRPKGGIPMRAEARNGRTAHAYAASDLRPQTSDLH
ncbi:MAG TPA: cytochrome P450 [Gemmatimonadaceae bacterium]|jgi:cytochrome P450